jgi:hypothetical protein
MIFKTFFFFLVIVFSSISHAQWWVDGGNLIWPYGNVSITKGTLNVGGIKEYIALITWHSSTDPTVNEIKNTLGDTVYIANVDDLGIQLEVNAGSSVFTYNKTSNTSFIYNDSDINRYVFGRRTGNTVYVLTSYNSAGDNAIQIDGFTFLLHIQVFPQNIKF